MAPPPPTPPLDAPPPRPGRWRIPGRISRARNPPRPALGGGPVRSDGGGRLRALDGLRLLAALMVCFYHYGGRDGEVAASWGASPRTLFPDLSPAFSYGPLGVQVFFLISGFVICMSGWGRTLLQFTASRSSRLYPAYWVAVIVVALAAVIPSVALDRFSVSDTLANLTMLQEPAGAKRVLGVDWTLWVELRFYLLFAVCVLARGATRRGVLRFCALWTVAAVIADSADDRLLTTVLMPEYAPFFIGGMGLYLLHRFGHSTPVWAVVGVSWLLGQHYAVRSLVAPASMDVFYHRRALVVIAIVTAGFAVIAATALGKLSWARWRWLTVAGALTYPFYLVHEHLGWVAIAGLHELGLRPAATLAVTVVSMLLLAYVMNRFVEQPITPRLKKAILKSAPAARNSQPRSPRG